MKKNILLLLMMFILILAGCNVSDSSKNNTEKEAKSDFPNKPIEMIIPYAAGGSTDVAARVLVDVVSEYLPNNQTVAIVNKPGGAAIVGNTEVYNANPNGYKISLTTTSPLTILPHYGDTPFTHDSFQTIIRLTNTPQVLIVRDDAPGDNIEEWLEYAKKSDKGVNYATVGSGSTQHLTMESLIDAKGITMNNVIFQSDIESITALLGEHVDAAMVNAIGLKGYVESGDIRVLLNTGTVKSDLLNDVPMIKDLDVDIEGQVTLGIIGPKELPQDIVEVLHDAFKQALEDPKVKEGFANIELSEFISYGDPEEFQKSLTDDFNNFEEVIEKLGLVE